MTTPIILQRSGSRELMSLQEAGTIPANKAPHSIVSVYSATFGAQMDLNAHLRTLIEEDEVKNLRRKKKGKVGESFEKALGQNDDLGSLNYHSLPLDKLLSDFGTSATAGLTDASAAEKLKTYGPNRLREKPTLPWYCKYLLEMVGLYPSILWVGSALSFLGYGLTPSDASNVCLGHSFQPWFQLYMGIALALVNVLNGSMSYYQNSRSEAIMAKFKDFIPPRSNVIRNSKREQIGATDLVPGDIIEIVSGDKIPADFRVISASEMKVDNSSLTGESEPQSRGKDAKKEKILEAENMVFFGTKCVEGKCLGVVVLTGENTVFGGIAALAQSAVQGESTMARDMNHFTFVITIIAVSLGLLFLGIGFMIGTGVITGIVNAIGIIVANVPEGLPMTLTISLAATAKRLGEKKVLVKNLQSVETLGSTCCICSDKTGTLTQNRMAPSHAFVCGKDYDCSVCQDEYEQLARAGQPVKPPKYSEPLFKTFAKYLALCSTVEIADPLDEEISQQIAKDLNLVSASDVTPDVFAREKERAKEKILHETLLKDRRTTLGNLTEAGILKFVASIVDYKKVRDAEPLVFEIPFKSAIKYNVMIRKVVEEGTGNFSRYLLLMKGASEKVLARCNRININGEIVDMTDELRLATEQKNNEYAMQGERVLGLAYLDLPPSKYGESVTFIPEGEGHNVPTTNLVFYGLISLYDPPRPGVEKSVDICRTAGIKVIMVTGDQPETAKAIAHQCHIITNLELEYGNMVKKGMSPDEAEAKCRAIVIHGDELLRRHKEDAKKSAVDPEKDLYLQRWLNKKEIVFARLNPAQKLIIVDACQKLGYIVGVTGDGVNDTPAIEQANIGIAMGSGSDVAKDAADVVLLTDDFSSIVLGVEEGRLIFDNMKKSIAYTLTSNIPELGPFLVYILFQLPLPLTTILILCIDLGSDLWPAISFAYEPAELDLMRRKPRDPSKDTLVGRKVISFAYLQIGIFELAAGMFAYFTVMMDYGFKPMNLFFYALKEGCVGDEDLRVYDWATTDDGKLSVKDFYGKCAKSKNKDLGQDSYYVPESDTLDTISSVTGEKVRYTSEALKYAQTSFWCSIVIMQWGVLLICKTRTLSFCQHGLRNLSSLYGFLFETGFMAFMVYVKPLNQAFGTRQLDIRHLGINAFPFCVLMVLYDEGRKYLMRLWSRIEAGKKPRYSWIYRNTYY